MTPTAGYCRLGAGIGRNDSARVASAGSVFNVVDRIAKIGEARVECHQHPPEGAPADIELSALHPGDVRVVGARTRADLALRQARPFTERTQRSAEDELVSVGVSHISGDL